MDRQDLLSSKVRLQSKLPSSNSLSSPPTLLLFVWARFVSPRLWPLPRVFFDRACLIPHCTHDFRFLALALKPLSLCTVPWYSSAFAGENSVCRKNSPNLRRQLQGTMLGLRTSRLAPMTWQVCLRQSSIYSQTMAITVCS